jgi:tetratricopeptide (TPR) repeat protein
MHSLLAELGSSAHSDPRLAGMVRVMLAYDPSDASGFETRLEALALDPDRYAARSANQWLSHVRESSGDTRGAIRAAESALASIDDADGPWNSAILRDQLAQLLMQEGKPEMAREHASAALSVMHRIGARDDEIQLHALLALCAMEAGRLEDAERELEELEERDYDSTAFGGRAFRQVGRAELALARGDYREGLTIYLDVADYMRNLKFPGLEQTGFEPWASFGEAAALTAYAHFADIADEQDERDGKELFHLCRTRTLRLASSTDGFIDCPILGMQMFALGAWGLLHDAIAVPEALRLLALAKHFSYVRMSPSLSWNRIFPLAEERAPGALEAMAAEYRGHRATDLFDQVRAAVEQIGA